MEGYWRYRRAQLGSWSHPGIERAAGNRLMGRGVLVIRRCGRDFTMAAVHLVEQGSVGLMD